MWDKFIHKTLKWPYTLAYVEYLSPRRPSHTIVMIHGIGSSARMWESIANKCPSDARVIAVDLLGFGNSPKPTWKVYNAKTHVDSVVTTLLSLRVSGPLIVVGHSLGSLVAVELAKRYPVMVKELLLCSPPFYNDSQPKKFGAESGLKTMYKALHDNPKNARFVLELASKYNYINAGFKVDDTNLATYLATLEASIRNQTSLADATKIKRPITILAGRLDVFVITKNIKYLQQAKPHVTVKFVTAGHEINSAYRNIIIDYLRRSSSHVR